jgi:site-specific recombinase XerD
MDKAIAAFRGYLERRCAGRSTAKHYISDLLIFRQFVGDIRPREVNVPMIDEFVQSQSQQGLKATTINRRLASLSSFFDFLAEQAEDDDWHNPVRWKRHSLKVGRHLPRDVNDDIIQRLFGVIHDERDRAIFTLMLSAGLRVSEVVGLQLQDLPMIETAILSRLRVSGKGDKERITWLTAETMRPVQAWLRQRPTSSTANVFLNQHGQPLSVSGIQYRLKQYCQQAQVEVTCHQLRHTFARRLAEQGVPIESLAKLLGHRSIQTTQLYIDGADPTLRHEFMTAMEKVTNIPASSPETNVSAPPTRFQPISPRREERDDPVAIADRLSHLTADLPDWLQQALRRYLISRISRWQPHQARLHAHNCLATLSRIGRWLVQQRHWSALDQLQRADLKAYVEACQLRGLKASSIGAELKTFGSFWRDLLDQEQVTNGAVLLVKAPPISDPLPAYLTPAEFQRLEQVILTDTAADTARDRFNRAWFYLLAHAGLRRGEVLNLRLADLDLSGQRLRVQAGKGDRDRILPMTERLTSVLGQYLAVREPAATDHLLIHRGASVGRSLIVCRLRQFGQQANIEPLYPHRLRHTLATLLVNQGMPITSLQKFLGHKDINKTLIYARVYDHTVCQQFAAAMAHIEGIPVADWPKQIEQLNPSLATVAYGTDDSV